MSFSIGGMMSQIPGQYTQKTDMPERKAGSEVTATGGEKSFASALSQAAVYEPSSAQQSSLTQTTYQNYGMTVKRNAVSSDTETEGTGLSEKAQALLEELKEKYSNMDFYVADVSSDEEAYDLMSQSTKEYSVLIDPETLEQMAQDEDFKNQCLSNIESSVSQMEDMFDQLSEEEAGNVQSVSMRMHADGTVEFFARLREASRQQAEELKETREENREEEKKEAAEEEEEETAQRLQEKIYLRADSMEDLLAQIRQALGTGEEDATEETETSDEAVTSAASVL